LKMTEMASGRAPKKNGCKCFVRSNETYHCFAVDEIPNGKRLARQPLLGQTSVQVLNETHTGLGQNRLVMGIARCCRVVIC